MKLATSLLLLVALLLPAASEPRKENWLVPLDAGATLEWKRNESQPAELWISRLEKRCEARELGYQKNDRILAIDGEPIGERTIVDFLRLSHHAREFLVQRKKQELTLPPLFRAAEVITGGDDHVLQPGKRPPKLRAKTLRGAEVKLSELAGHVVFINFWAVWCKPCLLEMPELLRLHRRYATEGLVLVSVNLDETRSVLENFLARNPLPFMVVHSPGMGSSLAWRFGVKVIPFSIILDRRGVIRQVYEGFGPEAFATSIEQPIEWLLADDRPVVTIVRKL